MCDIHPHGRLGWRGWPDRGAGRTSRPLGSWTDLSHPLHDAIPVPYVFPRPAFRRINAMPEQKLNVTQIEMVCHAGTHLDAPSHLFMDAPGFDEIPFERLQGLGVVWSIDVEPFGLITAGQLERMSPPPHEGDIVLLHTGWAERWETETYEDNPSLSLDAAEWLVARKVSLLGVDFATPDLALQKRDGDFDWPVHKALLSNGTLIAENVANLAALSGRRVEVVCGALNIRSADGSPARLIARAVEMSETI
jgi:kynurenine formamidase